MYQYNYFYEQQKALAENYEKRNIALAGKTVGTCSIGHILIQKLFSLVISFTPLINVYVDDPAFQASISVFLSVASVLIPFALGGMYLRKHLHDEVFCFEKPQGAGITVSVICLGFFLCLIGNYISGVIINVFDGAGVELSSPEHTAPDTVFGRIIYVIAVAVIPPLAEELAFRGTVLQPLRKYGDKFAIIISALVFALLHGNLIQAPFALIVGLGLGYAVCVTGSIWTSVVIHFLNNLFSVCTEFMLSDITDEVLLNRVYFMVVACLYIITLAGSVCFIILRGKKRLSSTPTALSGARKTAAYTLNIPVILALVLIGSTFMQYISLK